MHNYSLFAIKWTYFTTHKNNRMTVSFECIIAFFLQQHKTHTKPILGTFFPLIMKPSNNNMFSTFEQRLKIMKTTTGMRAIALKKQPIYLN